MHRLCKHSSLAMASGICRFNKEAAVSVDVSSNHGMGDSSGSVLVMSGSWLSRVAQPPLPVSLRPHSGKLEAFASLRSATFASLRSATAAATSSLLNSRYLVEALPLDHPLARCRTAQAHTHAATLTHAHLDPRPSSATHCGHFLLSNRANSCCARSGRDLGHGESHPFSPSLPS